MRRAFAGYTGTNDQSFAVRRPATPPSQLRVSSVARIPCSRAEVTPISAPLQRVVYTGSWLGGELASLLVSASYPNFSPSSNTVADRRAKQLLQQQSGVIDQIVDIDRQLDS